MFTVGTDDVRSKFQSVRRSSCLLSVAYILTVLPPVLAISDIVYGLNIVYIVSTAKTLVKFIRSWNSRKKVWRKHSSTIQWTEDKIAYNLLLKN